MAHWYRALGRDVAVSFGGPSKIRLPTMPPATARTTTMIRMPIRFMGTSLLRRTAFALVAARKLRPDGTLEVRVCLLELRVRLDVLDVNRLQRARGIDEREPVDATGLVRALGYPQRLLRLGDVRVDE